MDFKVTSWTERNYKWVIAIIVFVASLGAVIYYICLEIKSDTFIAALLYALFLFVVSMWANHMSNMIDNKLYDRIEIYLNLKKIYETFEEVNIIKHTDYKALKFIIIFFQVYTNRTEHKPGDDHPPFIKELGIKIKEKELDVENEFLELYDGESSIAHASEDESPELERLSLKIYKLYTGYLSRSKASIEQLEKMYGSKLFHLISQQKEIRSNTEWMFKQLDEMEERITNQLDEHDEKIESYVDCLERIEPMIEGLCVDMSDMIAKSDD